MLAPLPHHKPRGGEPRGGHVDDQGRELPEHRAETRRHQAAVTVPRAAAEFLHQWPRPIRGRSRGRSQRRAGEVVAGTLNHETHERHERGH